mgnify:CR=1 FL=1
MDKLTSMSVFVRVAKAGSFAGGASELGISRAMATKHIMQLEGSLGTRLFNRTTRSLNLTDVGASYLERCQQVLLDIEEMEAANRGLIDKALDAVKGVIETIIKIKDPTSRRVLPCLFFFISSHIRE